MIQDLANQTYDNTYKHEKPQDGDVMFVFEGRDVLFKVGEGQVLPRYEALKHNITQCVYLFTIGEERYFLGEGCGIQGLEGYAFESINVVRTMQPKEAAFATITAFHLYNWYRTNQRCGCCGEKLVHSEKERALRCPGCGNMVFPRISPAVIVGVTNGDELLMTKYAGREYKKYALVAGFCEIGETPERTVAREVMEEVGLKVKNIRYYKSQPWGLAGDLLLGFFAEVEGDTKIHLDEQELSEGTWIKREDIAFEADEVTLTSEMIMHFKNNS